MNTRNERAGRSMSSFEAAECAAAGTRASGISGADTAPKLSPTKRPSATRLRRERRIALGVVVVPFAGFAIALAAYGNRLTTLDVVLFVSSYLVTAFGITVGFHRLVSHQSFHCGATVRALFAIAGSLAVQGPAIRWAADHRRHHQFPDQPGDPHSPHLSEEHPEGSLRDLAANLWHAHIGWFFDDDKTTIRRYVPDLLADPVIRTVDRLYPLWLLLSVGTPAAIAWLWTGGNGSATLSAFLFAGLGRIFLFQHVTWSVNSICHYFGTRAFETSDESRNNWVMAILALGEGWHNNHHAFPASARQGLTRWQLDPSFWLIRSLAAVRLADILHDAGSRSTKSGTGRSIRGTGVTADPSG